MAGVESEKNLGNSRMIIPLKTLRILTGVPGSGGVPIPMEKLEMIVTRLSKDTLSVLAKPQQTSTDSDPFPPQRSI
ncbi:MAG: hypothetical protein Q8P92_05440 [Candidatus Daviesbacteria bacterium]|nr:hypothetical protein [Candidatus Daviesbacteria bacterium]